MPSTVIKQLEYHRDTKSLKIQFVSGLIYLYNDVPEEVYDQFRSYREKGIFFNNHIKNKYSFTRLHAGRADGVSDTE
jgi:lysyl-tRNA synthetase class 2